MNTNEIKTSENKTPDIKTPEKNPEKNQKNGAIQITKRENTISLNTSPLRAKSDLSEKSPAADKESDKPHIRSLSEKEQLPQATSPREGLPQDAPSEKKEAQKDWSTSIIEETQKLESAVQRFAASKPMTIALAALATGIVAGLIMRKTLAAPQESV